MSNFLHEGYLVKRSNGTTEKYLDWDLMEIQHFEKIKGEHVDDSIFIRTYEIENETHTYYFDETRSVFTDHNKWADDYTEFSNVGPELAGYLWSTCTEIDEDSVRPLYMMACDIFGGYANWKSNALCHIINQFQRDEDFINIMYVQGGEIQ